MDQSEQIDREIFSAAAFQIRPPLFSLLGLIEIIKKNSEENLTEGQLNRLDMIMERINNISSVINWNLEYRHKPLSTPGSNLKKSGNQNFHILIADPDAINMMILNDHINSAGYNSYSAVNAMGLFEIMNSKKIKVDMVIIDNCLPDMDGLTVIKKIREKHSPVEMPVIIFSSSSDQKVIDEYREAGADHYLVKPLSKSELIEDIQTLLNIKKSKKNLKS